MTDISSWQRTLEPLGYAVNPDKLATDLYECSLLTFLGLIRYCSAEPALLQRIRTQLQRFQLWGSDFDAREGGLDEKIVNSDRLKDVLLPVLSRMADALVKIASRRSLDTELEGVMFKVRLLNEQSLGTKVHNGPGGEDAEPDGLQNASILDEITSSGSEVSSIDESREIDELLQDVKSSNDCLFQLGSVLQDSAESILLNSGNVYGSTAVNLSLLHNTAWPYISNILEAYPSIDRDFARRLGEANERRYNRLQIQRDKAIAEAQSPESASSDEESVRGLSLTQASRQMSSGIAQSASTAPSTKLSSVFDTLRLSTPDPAIGKAPKTALSATTFASSLGGSEGQKRGRGLPKMPDDQPWGTPFNCTVCGDTLSNVWSSMEWERHVYRDLQPYICTFPNCSSENGAFVSLHEWSTHELDMHRKHIVWACGQCEPGKSNFTTEAQLKNHFPKHHPALGPHQVASFMRSASECVANCISSERCPFCLTYPASTPAQLMSHVARHLQKVAHAAIPMSLMSEDAKSLEGTDASDDEVQGEIPPEASSIMAGLPNPTASTGNGGVDVGHQTNSSNFILYCISSITKVVKSLNEILESYNDVAHNMTLIVSQLSTMRAALEAIHAWRVSDDFKTGATTQLYKHLNLSLSCCTILITVIGSKLTESGYESRLGTKQKIRYVWLEESLKEYMSNLDGQVRALQLLLTICQCRTLTEQRHQLASQGSRKIIEQVRAETMEIDDAMSILSGDPSVYLNVDPISLRSRAYMQVRKEMQVGSSAGNSSKAGDPLSTTASITAIAHLLGRLVNLGSDSYKSKRRRIALSESMEQLLIKVKALQVLNERIVCIESGPWYAGLPVSFKNVRQAEHERDTNMLETVRSSVEDMFQGLKARRGFRANARRLLNFQEKKSFQETVKITKNWTSVVDSVIERYQRLIGLEMNDPLSESDDRVEHLEAGCGEQTQLRGVSIAEVLTTIRHVS